MKRFTETTKWQDPWFRKLCPRLKCLWLNLLDTCDQAGVIDPDWELIGFQIGDSVSTSDMEHFEDRIAELTNGKVWILKFVKFQNGELSAGCPSHKPILAKIEEHKLIGYQYPFNTPSMGYQYPIGKGKGKEEVKNEGGVGETLIPDVLQSVQGFTSEWAHFKAHRKAKKAKMTPHAEELFLRKLSERPAMSIAAMQMCQERGWTGFEWEWMESKSAKPRQTEADRDRLNTGLDENIKIKVLN